MKKIIIIIAGGSGLVIGIFLFFPTSVDPIDYVLYSDTIFTEKMVFRADDSTLSRKHVFRNVTFENTDIWFLAASSEGSLTKDKFFDSLVFENCRWTGYKDQGLRIRGSHKYVKVSGSIFIASSGPAKKRALAFTANVSPANGIDFRVGEVIIQGNYIENKGSDSVAIGEGIFAQKLSKFHVINNRFVIDGKVGAAIKFDDVEGLTEYPTDILIKYNNFDIDNAYSSITFEQSDGSITDSVRVIENWFNFPVRYINTSIPGSEFTGNKFDYLDANADVGPWYNSMSRIINNQSWDDNYFSGCNCTMIEINPTVDTAQIFNNNKFAEGVKVAIRQDGGGWVHITL